MAQLRPLVEDLSEAALADLEEHFEWFGISGGATLFSQGEVANEAFILTSGRLGVFVDVGLGMRLVAQIQPGELVGEMALISGEPRSATVVALRDSEVVRVPADTAERLTTSSPQLMFYVLRLLVTRLRTTTRRPMLEEATRALAIVPLGKGLPEDLTGVLRAAFRALPGRIEVLDEGHDDLTTEAIQAVEENHDLVVYLASSRSSAWSRRCLRQADRVIFVAPADSRPDADCEMQIAKVRDLHRSADLMLVNEPSAARPVGATHWLGQFAPDHIFHVRKDDREDHDRVVRMTTGRAIGVVLSGGGARGFAHVGAIRALYESKIPIDLVGGTSMGAIVAASAALDVDVREVSRKVHHGFVLNNPVSDYTFPIIALSRGRKMSWLLRHHFGDSLIEDAWKKFFCVSSNLSTGRVAVHQQGLFWRALRATAAIPGIVPPFIDGSDVLVDGGIMNNFPANIMSSFARGPVIGIEVTAGTPFTASESEIEDRSLMWLLGQGRKAVPSIFRVLMRSGTVSSEAQTVASRSSVDLLIQPTLGPIDMLAFESFDVAVEAGYRATMEAIEKLEKPLV